VLAELIADAVAEADRLLDSADPWTALCEFAVVAWQDVPFLLASVATGVTTLGLRATGQQWERNLRIILDGMRAPSPDPLPGQAPSLS
jgi:hypothetical protein